MQATPTARDLVAARKAQAPLNARPQPTAVAVAATPELSTPGAYLDEVAPQSIVGRLVKFDKAGTFVTADDGQELPEDAEFLALCDETLVGWIKFNGEGESPDRVMGLLYGSDFAMPSRQSLGDLDPTEWEPGLDNQPQDPWLHQMLLVLQNTDTFELFTFQTSSKTGRRAVGNLLRHYDRMRKQQPDELPVVRVRTGGFQHKDSRVGFVNTPVFVVCGKAPRDSGAKPDTSMAAFLDDALPL